MKGPALPTAERVARPLRVRGSDHGREMTYDEFTHAIFQEGHKYELIDGRIYVSPLANAPADHLEIWLFRILDRYGLLNPDFINYVTNKGRVFVPGHEKTTCPEPDITAFRNYPLHLPLDQLDWRDFEPLLVVEVIAEGDPKKDYERNVELYRQVATIKEYWILDHRPNPNEPKLIVYRRRGKRWQKPIEVLYGETYETKLLPGFKLIVDPRA
jgi:Uma2 family endonuclease